MQSPAASFLEDVVGAKAVLDGKAQRARGIAVKGDRITITLTKVAPDFVSRMTLPFFSAIPANLAVDSKGVGAPLVSAGPYNVREWTPGRTATVVRNPYWNRNREPWKSLGRPANVDSIQYTIGNSLEATRLRLESSALDLGAVPPSAHAELAQKYGISKERWFVRKQQVMWYFALNAEQPLFRGNATLRQAINRAIDRPQLVRQFGYLGGAHTDQVIPPGMLGYVNHSIYPLGGVNAGTRGEPFDVTFEGWGADYPDPYLFLNKLLDGTSIRAANNNNNMSYFNDPAWNRRLKAAALLSGDARGKAYAELDRGIMRDAAPLAPFITQNARILVGQEVGCYSFRPVLGTANLVAVCKK